MNTKHYVVSRAKQALRKAYRGLRSGIRYIDYNVSLNFDYFCPVCNRKVKKFIPLNSFYSENMKKYGYPFRIADLETLNEKHYHCPHCSATDRVRLCALYFHHQFPQRASTPPLRLLDIAPAPCFQLFLSKYERLKYRSADLYMEGVDDVVDITDMHAYKDGSFDIFVCSHVLEHVPDDTKALSELFRVLAPGGWGILMVPINLKLTQIDEDPSITDIAERWRRFGQNDHVRIYSKTGFLERVEDAGFVINQLGIAFFGAEVFQKHGISSQSVLYVVEKP